MKKKRKNRGILYALVGLLVAAGAMAGVAAKETASVYDAPDLHLTQGSEKYDLTEGITYDSGKYELAVKDTGDFDINIIGEYQVGYTLTPKGAETIREEGETAAAENGDAAVATQEAAAEQSAQAGETAAENGDAAVDTQEADSEEETILFKRTVFVDAEVVDGYYLYAPVLEVEAGSTDYNLLEGVELRKADTDEKVEGAKITVKDEGSLEAGAMTGEELAAYNNETEAGETEAAEEGTQDETEDTTEHPALKEGTYEVTVEAENPETEETLHIAREISATRASYLMSVFNQKGEPLEGGGINKLGAEKTKKVLEPNGWAYSNKSDPPGSPMYIKITEIYKQESTTDNLATRLGYKGVWKDGRKKDGNTTFIYEHESVFKGNWWRNMSGQNTLGPDEIVSGTVQFNTNVPKTALDFENLPSQIEDIGPHCYMIVDGQGRNLTFPDANGASNPRFTWTIPAGMQVALKNIHFNNWTSGTGNKWGYITLNGNYLRLENITGKGKDGDGNPGYRLAGTLYLKNEGKGSTVEIVGGTSSKGQQLYYSISSGFDSIILRSSEAESTTYFSPIRIDSTKNLKLVSLQGQQIRLYYTNATNVEMEGPIIFDNRDHVNLSGNGFSSRGVLDNLVLTGDTTIYKSSMYRGGKAAIDNIKSFVSNGYKISGQGNCFALQNNEIFAEGTNVGVLDATDFYVANPDEKTTEVAAGRLYFTSTDNGTKIKTTQLNTEPIMVTPDVGGKSHFKSYETALKAIKENGTGTEYTITNLIEREFTQDAAGTLAAIPKEKATKLTFESGTRTDDDGAAGTRYRIRMRVQTLQLPAEAEVTFQNIVLKYAEGTRSEIKDAQGNDVQDLVFVNNGGKLTFGENVKFLAGDNNAEGYPTVYGGAEGQDCTTAATLTFQSGTYAAVYGGNKGTGSHTEKATITVENEATIRDTLSGGGNKETTKAGNKTAEITVNNELSVNNIYDYDKLTIENAITVKSTMNSQQVSDYQGETLLASEARFTLEKSAGIKQMGSLKMKEGAAKNATLRLARAAEEDGKDASNKKNPYILTLTGTKPMKSQTAKIDVAYASGNTETDSDIVFYLPNAEPEAEVTCEPLKSSFSLAMREKPADKTIRIYDVSVRLEDEDENKQENFISIEEAINKLAEWEWDETAAAGKQHTYKIVFLKDYSIDSLPGDIQALEDVMKNGTERSKARTAKKITWCANKNANGGTAEQKTVSLSQDLKLFGINGEEATQTTKTAKLKAAKASTKAKATTQDATTGRTENVLENITLKGTGAYTIYANGTDLTIGSGVKTAGQNPNVQGGSKAAADTGTPGGAGEGNATEATADTVNSKPENSISVFQTITLNDVRDFRKLTIGTGETDTNKKVTLTVAGELNSNSKLPADDKSRDDTVCLKNAHLKLTGSESSSIGSLSAQGSTENELTIPKNIVTYPLKISKSTVLESDKNPIKINVTNGEKDHDIIIEYQDEENAKKEQYTLGTDSLYKIISSGKNLVIMNNNGVYEITTSAGLKGIIGEVNGKNASFGLPAQYQQTLSGSGNEYNSLKDVSYAAAGTQWHTRAPLIASDRQDSQWHISKWLRPTNAIMQKVGTNGESYTVYEWETRLNTFPALAGLKDTLYLGYKNGGFTNNEIQKAFRNEELSKDYYYDSKTGSGTYQQQKADWKNLDKGTDFYDYKNDKWVENPTADVDIKLLRPYNFNRISILHSKDSSEIFQAVQNIDEQSSVKIDFNGYIFSVEQKNDTGGALNQEGWHKLLNNGLSKMQYYITNVNFAKNGTVEFYRSSDGDGKRKSTIVLDNAMAPGAVYTSETNRPRSWVRIHDVANAKCIFSDRQTTTNTEALSYQIYNVDNAAIISNNNTLKTWIKVHDIAKSLLIDTGKKGTSMWASAIGKNHGEWSSTDYNSMRLTFKGNGTINVVEQSKEYGEEARGTITADIIDLQGNPVLSKPEKRGTEHAFIQVGGSMESNGHQIQARLMRIGDTWNMNNAYTDAVCNAVAPKNSTYSVYATTRKDGVYFDATDFRIADEDKATYEGYHVTTVPTNDGKRNAIYIKKVTEADGTIVTDPIKVISKKDGIKCYPTYEAAFTAIREKGDKTEEYTIKNLVEWSFTKEDQAALKEITTAHAAKLTFESGERTDTDGAAGNRYRVRMRVQKLELPKDVNVTFQNIVMKYDQGTQTEVKDNDGTITSYEMTFAGNGGTLEFGNGVVFLKHNDEPMKPTVYGGSLNDSNLETTTASTVVLNSGTFTAVYGAGTKAQNCASAVSMPVNSTAVVEKLFGAGSAGGDVTGDVNVQVLGGTVNAPVYGGGEGAEVTGNTTVTVSGGIVPKSETVKVDKPATPTSVYGGGKGATVSGTSSVTVTLPNNNADDDHRVFKMGTISGAGTDNNGELKENSVGAKKTVVVQMNDTTKIAELMLEKLRGFDNLTLGNAGGNDFNKSIFKITQEFDSKAEVSQANDREDQVTLNASRLVLDGKYQGHIGNLTTNKISSLSVYKEDTNQTKPLLVDGKVTAGKDATGVREQIRLKTTFAPNEATGKTMNEINDIILTFTKAANADEIQYVDGGKTELSVEKDDQGNIYFVEPEAHNVLSYVEYPKKADGTLENALDRNAIMASKKILHFKYDNGNTHGVRTGAGKGGYVIRIPKTEATTLKKAEQLVYIRMNEGFKTNGIFTGTDFTGDTKRFTEGTDYWRITFTNDPNSANATTGVQSASGVTTTADGTETAVKIDSNYWYIAHVLCERGEVASIIVDNNAPKQETEGKVTKTELDTKEDKYEYTFEIADPQVNNGTNLTPYKPTTKATTGDDRMPYSAHGISKVFWTFGTADETTEEALKADAAAAKRDATVDGIILKGIATTITSLDGTKDHVEQGEDAKVKISVAKSDFEDAKAAGKTILWVYVKDSVNNTVKLPINLKEAVINVRVPLKVNVVAVKKANGGTCELLAPKCYVVNDGAKPVTAAVNGFATTTTTNDKLRLVEDKKANETYSESEIALQLKPVTGDAFNKTNVLMLSNANKLTIGTMQPKKGVVSYTFDAAYNVTDINIPDGWISNTMSYHFTTVNN